MRPTPVDPIAGCLLMVARWHGINTSLEALTAGLPQVNQALAPSQLARSASRVGLVCKLAKKAIPEIKPGLMPAILLLQSNKACVLVAHNATEETCDVMWPDGKGEIVTLPVTELTEAFVGIAAFVRPRFHFDARAPSSVGGSHRHWFWGVILENAPVYRDVLVTALLINLFALAAPLFVMNVYDRVVPNFAVETLWALAIGMFLVIIADFILRSMRAYFIDLAARRADIKLSASIMEKVLGLRMDARPNSAGSFAASLRAFETVRDFIASTTITTLIDLPFGLLFIGLIIWLAWPLALPLIAGVLLIMGYAVITSRRMRELAETTYRASAQRNATLIETLVGLDTLKALGAESFMQRRWELTSSFLSRVTVQLRMLAASNTHAAMWVQQVSYVAVIAGGVYLIADARLSLGGLIACSILTSRALAPFAQLATLITQYHNTAASMHTLNEIMAKPVERPMGTKFLSRQKFDGQIEFKNVSFSYPGSEVEIIRNVSFSVTAGEHVVILGRVGSGKSTLLRLAMGLYQPSAGAVLIDGIDLRQLDPAELRSSIGYVPQEATLFYGSLRDNLLLGRSQLEDEKIMQVLELAGLDEYVKTHPNGLDMLIGERGESLSGGQRKAVAVARGLVHQPGVILLDEPTGSMDHSTEVLVRQNLQRYSQSKTLLMVTHHTSLLDLADRIVVVDAGKIVADGPKAQVVEALRAGRIGRAT